jgi:hypothetical protein
MKSTENRLLRFWQTFLSVNEMDHLFFDEFRKESKRLQAGAPVTYTTIGEKIETITDPCMILLGPLNESAVMI